MTIAVAPTSMINLECQFLSYFLCYEYHSSALFTLILYIEIQPNAFATELNNIITAKIGHKYLIITINIFLLRNELSPCMTSSSIRCIPTTFDTNKHVINAAIGIITEFVIKSKKSRNCIPIIFTTASGPYPSEDRLPRATIIILEYFWDCNKHQ